MKKILLAGLAIGLGLTSSAQATPIWHEYNEHEYALTETYTNWTGAQTIANTYSATLVTIETINENIWLDSTFQGLTYGKNSGTNAWMSAAWIGLYKEVSGSWYWDSTKSIASYIPTSSFSTGSDGIHAYMHISPHPWAGSWNNDGSHDSSSGNFYGIMERESSNSVVPEPATILLFGAGIAGLAAVGRRKRS